MLTDAAVLGADIFTLPQNDIRKIVCAIDNAKDVKKKSSGANASQILSCSSFCNARARILAHLRPLQKRSPSSQKYFLRS